MRRRKKFTARKRNFTWLAVEGRVCWRWKVEEEEEEESL